VIRGGGWNSYGSDCQAADRPRWGRPWEGSSICGFRLARVPVR
jgi:formylglycine-generating enzyme required for sulfatase activity